MPAKINLIGHRFGRLIVLKDSEPRLVNGGIRNTHVVCVCDCGKTAIVSKGHLRIGHTKSCGCLMAEATPFLGSHGRSGTRIHRLWVDMRKRCTNPKCNNFHNYGGRGIKVCPRWDSFENFLSDMGEGKVGWSLERVDNMVGYSPENVIWATSKHQNRNRRDNCIVTVKGITGPFIAVCEHFHISEKTVRGRLSRGWPIEPAFCMSKQKGIRGHKIKF